MKPKCPHVIRMQAGDETYDICELNTKSCLIEHGQYECEEFNFWLKEHEQEEEISHQYDVNENNESKWRYHASR